MDSLDTVYQAVDGDTTACHGMPDSTRTDTVITVTLYNRSFNTCMQRDKPALLVTDRSTSQLAAHVGRAK